MLFRQTKSETASASGDEQITWNARSIVKATRPGVDQIKPKQGYGVGTVRPISSKNEGTNTVPCFTCCLHNKVK